MQYVESTNELINGIEGENLTKSMKAMKVVNTATEKAVKGVRFANRSLRFARLSAKMDLCCPSASGPLGLNNVGGIWTEKKVCRKS